MCRKEAYQTRVVHEGVNHLREKMAIVYEYYIIGVMGIIWTPTLPLDSVVCNQVRGPAVYISGCLT